VLSNTFHLTLMMGPLVTSPVPREVIESLVSISVTNKSGDRSGFQLVFNISKTGTIQRVLLPSGFFEPILTRVQIVVTMGGTAKVLMDGIIARHELQISNDPGKSTLTITGEDVSLAMDLVDATGIPYPCMPPEARVLAILGGFSMFGFIPEIIPSLLLDVPIPIERIPSHRGTFLEYIKELAKEVGYVFYVDHLSLGVNRAYWGPDIRWGDVQKAITINSDGTSNADSISFSFDGLAGSLFYIEVQIPNLCGAIPIPIPPLAILRPPLAQQIPIPHKFQKVENTSKYGPIRGALIGLTKALAANDAVTAQGTLNVLQYGAILDARSLVDVRGAGIAYDGRYYVKEVTHNIKRGEYKQSFSLVREGLVPTEPKVQV
jgi:hypothetical protein